MVRTVISLLGIGLLLLGLGACSSQPKSLVNYEQAALYNTQLGIEYLKQGRYSFSSRKFEKAFKFEKHLTEKSDRARLYAGYALLLSRLDQDEEAMKHIKKAVRTDPDNADILNNYGTILCQQGQLQEAEKQFLQALKDPLYETPEFAYTNAGICSLKVGDHDKAEAYFTKALSRNRNFPDALLQMAALGEARGNFRLARAYLTKFEDLIEPIAQSKVRHTPDSLWLAIKISKGIGDKNAAASYRLRLRNQFPESPITQRMSSN